jgi:four helix bundle suffix protein
MEDYQKKPGSYKTLKAYQKSECVFDITYYFVEHFLDRGHDRTVDQMQQAARSGKQNIVEGYSDAEGSSDSYHRLAVIAKGSLEELLEDFEDYLRVHQLERWGQQHPKYIACIPLFQKHNDSQWYRRQIEGRSDEDIANIAIIVIHQTLALLRGLIDRIDKKFLEEGGIKEQRFQARLKYRNNQRDSREIRETPNDPKTPYSPNGPKTPNNPNHQP